MLKLQLGRYAKNVSDGYEIGKRGAKWRMKSGFSSDIEEGALSGFVFGFCPEKFEEIIGLTIARGEVHNVTITIRLEP